MDSSSFASPEQAEPFQLPPAARHQVTERPMLELASSHVLYVHEVVVGAEH
ncbi:MAG: hypothetical protein V4632_07695 [Pseudomonadota bacterium]